MKFRPVSLAVVSALALGAVGVPSFASAQSDAPPPPPARAEAPPPAPGPYADPCRQARNNRVAGGVIGAIAGAVLGSNVAGHGAKSEGGAIGGVAGALIGSQVAKGSQASLACYGAGGPPPAPAPAYGYGPRPPYGYGQGYYGRGPAQPYGTVDHGYADGYGYGAPPPRADRYDDRDDRYADRDDRDDDDRDYGVRRTGDGSGPDGCKLAESPIFMPDGRTEKRYVRVCADASGRYHVVD
jgi:hypothetical protein